MGRKKKKKSNLADVVLDKDTVDIINRAFLKSQELIIMLAHKRTQYEDYKYDCRDFFEDKCGFKKFIDESLNLINDSYLKFINSLNDRKLTRAIELYFSRIKNIPKQLKKRYGEFQEEMIESFRTKNRFNENTKRVPYDFSDFIDRQEYHSHMGRPEFSREEIKKSKNEKYWDKTFLKKLSKYKSKLDRPKS